MANKRIQSARKEITLDKIFQLDEALTYFCENYAIFFYTKINIKYINHTQANYKACIPRKFVLNKPN